MELYLAERLRKYRRSKGLTQETVAHAFGVSAQSVSKWERGDGYPDITLLPRIANYFGVSIDTLLGNDELTKEEDIKNYYQTVYEIEDEEEQIRYSIEYARKYPNDYAIVYNICWHIIQLPEDKRESWIPTLKEYCEAIIRECTSQNIREAAIEFMCSTCPDSEFERWYGMCADEYDAYKGEVLENRLWEKKKYTESSLRHDVNNLRLLLHFMFRDNRNWDAPERAAEWFIYRIWMIEFFTQCSPDCKIPEAWIGPLAELYFRLSCASFGRGRIEAGYNYLERAFELYPEWFNIPNKTALDVGSPEVYGGVKIVKDEWAIILPDGSEEWCVDTSYFKDGHSFMYTAMTQPDGWEWFDCVRGEERFMEFVERAKKFASSDTTAE